MIGNWNYFQNRIITTLKLRKIPSFHNMLHNVILYNLLPMKDDDVEKNDSLDKIDITNKKP